MKSAKWPKLLTRFSMLKSITLDILPLESENLDYSEHEDWSLYLRLLAPIEVFLADGVSDSSFFDSTISVITEFGSYL